MSAKLGMGVVGTGFMGALQAKIWSQLPHTKLVGVTDPNEQAGRAVADELGTKYYPDLDGLLADPELDAVSIVTPDRLHVEPVRAAAKAGKDILLEKPMAHNAQAAAEIANIVEKAGVRLMVGHVLRFDARYAQLFTASEPSKLGDPINLRAKRNTTRSNAARLGSRSSILYYLGVHDIDAMQWVARSPIVRVYAQKVEKLNSGNENCVYAVVNYANGAIGNLDYCWSWPDGFPSGFNAEFEVVGTESSVLIDLRDQGYQVINAQGPVSTDTHLWPEINGMVTGGLRDELLHFATAVQTGAPFVQDYRDALDAVRVVDALFASLESGEPALVKRP